MKEKISDEDLMASVANNLSIMDRLLDDRQLNVSTNSLIRLGYNCFVHDITSTKDTRLLTSEGYQHIFFKYQQELNQLIISTSELERE